MNRIDRVFAELRAAGRKGLVGYLTAGDPDMVQSETDIRTALDAGVDVLELGVPFSDPTADGPTIQEASQRSLAGGTTVDGVLALVRRLRADYDTPIVLFGYSNPFFYRGVEKVCAEAAEAGADGFLCVDVPFEESAEFRGVCAANGLHFIPLIAPTTPPERMKVVLAEASGFVYYVMVTGVTGTRSAEAVDVSEHVLQVKACTGLPVAVGFGVSTGAQAKAVAAEADAVVVGSALIRAAREGRLKELVEELAGAL